MYYKILANNKVIKMAAKILILASGSVLQDLYLTIKKRTEANSARLFIEYKNKEMNPFNI